MSQARLVFAVAAVMTLGFGCRTLSERQDVPALITNPTPESRAELRRIVSGALRGATVTIADDALTASSLLTIERMRPRDAQGRPLSGRDLDRPHRFRLVKSDSRCVLIRQADGERWELTRTTCVPEVAPR